MQNSPMPFGKQLVLPDTKIKAEARWGEFRTILLHKPDNSSYFKDFLQTANTMAMVSTSESGSHRLPN